MVKVSIVVPIYHVEQYLHQCLDSIVTQTLKDIEIILVDDGSDDNCAQIIDEYAQLDRRIIVIHKKNGGYGSACNAGIKIATGEYIGIVEPDDWIETNMYEQLYQQITKYDADVCIAGYYNYQTIEETPIDTQINENNLNTDDQSTFSILDSPGLYTTHQSIWSKLYKSSLIKSIKFDERPGMAYQDGPFITEVFCKTKKLIGLHKHLYHYRVDNINSSSHNHRHDRSLMCILDQMEKARQILKEYNLYSPLKEAFYFQVSKAGLRFYHNIDLEYKREFFDKWHTFASDLQNDPSFTFKYFDERRRHTLECILSNDFNGSLYDSYRAYKICGLPLLEVATVNNVVLRKMFGMTVYRREYENGVYIRYFLGDSISFFRNEGFYILKVDKHSIIIHSQRALTKHHTDQIRTQAIQLMELEKKVLEIARQLEINQESITEYNDIMNQLHNTYLLSHRGARLTREKKYLRDSVNTKTIAGDYQLVTNNCLCGAQDDQLVAVRDRYGIKINTVICHHCGLIRANPYYTSTTLDQFYNSEYRRLYTFVNNDIEKFFCDQVRAGQVILDNVNSYLTWQTRGKRIYEVGTGMGGILQPFAENGAIIKGVDVGRKYIELGRKKGLDLEIGDYQVLKKYPPADLIILSHVVEHMTNPIEFLSNLRDIINKSGLIYIAVPTIETITINYGNNLFAYLQNAHAFYFSQNTLRYVAECAGYEVVKSLTNQGVVICRPSTNKRDLSEVNPRECERALSLLRVNEENFQKKQRVKGN